MPTVAGADGNSTGNGTAPDPDDGPKLPPLVLSAFEKVWLQVGWIVLAFGVLLVGTLTFFFWPYPSTWQHPSRTGALFAQEKPVAAHVYTVLSGGSPRSPYVNALIAGVAMVNFVFYAMRTEDNYRRKTGENGGYLGNWVVPTDDTIQILSLAFFMVMLLLRLLAAQADPIWASNRPPWAASLRYFMCDFYIHVDVCGMLPSIIEICVGRDILPNLMWLSTARTIEIISRQPGVGAGIRCMTNCLKHDLPLILIIFIFGMILWLVLSGLYFLANHDNEATRWDAAVYQGRGWQRFESIPASMFFVLINLCHEVPLAQDHNSLFSRAVVIFVVTVAVPLFALPTGIVGMAIHREASRAIKDEVELSQGSLSRSPSLSEPLTPLGASTGLATAAASPSAASGPALSPTAAASTATSSPDGSTPLSPPDSRRLTSNSLAALAMPLGPPGVVVLLDAQQDRGRQQQAEAADAASECDEAPTWWETALPLLQPIGTGVLAFGSVIVYFFYTAGRVEFCFMRFRVNSVLFTVVDGLTSLIFGAEWAYRTREGGWQYVRSVLGLVDFAAWISGLFHLLMVGFVPPGGILDGVCAACVLRVFKLERYVGSIKDMGEILGAQIHIIKATCFVAFLMWLSLSVALYFTERRNPDYDMVDNYGSVARSIWSEIVNLHGEWPLCDYTAAGKFIGTFICLVSSSIFMLPIAIFNDGFMSRMSGDGLLASVQRMKPWRLAHRPQEAGARHEIWNLLYWHMLENRVRHRGFKVFRFFSVFFTLGVTAVATVLTLPIFGAAQEDQCAASRTCESVWDALFWFDVVASVFFTAEMLLHLVALGWRHLFSFVGICDCVSLAAMYWSLGPYRLDGFSPEYMTSFILDDITVPCRLLRLFMLELYAPALHVLADVVRLARYSLLRSFIALVAVWYVYATLLYLFERGDGPLPVDYDSDDWSNARRYGDVLTALQYSLVHLTGDYPIIEYTFPAMIVHCFGIIGGICFVAAFTGVFTAGFVSYLAEQREEERLRKAQQRNADVLKVTVLLRARLRRLRSQASERLSNAVEESTPSSLRSGIQSVREVVTWQSRCRQNVRFWAKRTVKRHTCFGKCFMSAANVALVVNVFNTLISTMPEVDENKTLWALASAVEVCTGTMFLLEYLVWLAAASQTWKSIFRPMRLIDLFCIFPTVSRLCFTADTTRWRATNGTILRLTEFGLIFRVVRVLDFPCIRREALMLWRTLVMAVRGLALPGVLAVEVWFVTASLFLWLENLYHGPTADVLHSLPDSLYYTSIYLIGEWANVDFSPGAGSRLCIFCCLYGIALFAIPVGLVVEAVQCTLQEIAEEQRTRARLSVLSAFTEPVPSLTKNLSERDRARLSRKSDYLPRWQEVSENAGPDGEESTPADSPGAGLATP